MTHCTSMTSVKAQIGAAIPEFQAADMGSGARLKKAGVRIGLTPNLPRLDILGKNGLLLEAYSGGSWWDAELVRKEGRTYRIHYDNFTPGYDEELPAKLLRLRSRKATVDDCSDILEVGVDVTVFAPHPHAQLMTGCASRSSAWYDARIVKVYRRSHHRACQCKFVVEFYEVKQDRVTKAWDLEHRQLLRGSRTVGIGKICVLQKQLRGSLEQLLDEVQLTAGEFTKTVSINSGSSQGQTSKWLRKFFAANRLKAQEAMGAEPSECKPGMDSHVELSLSTAPELGPIAHTMDCCTSGGNAQRICAGIVSVSKLTGMHQEAIDCTISQQETSPLRGKRMEENHNYSGSRPGFVRCWSPRLNRLGNLAPSQTYKPLERTSPDRERHWVHNLSDSKDRRVSALPEVLHLVPAAQRGFSTLYSENIARPLDPSQDEKQVQLQDSAHCQEDSSHRSVGWKLDKVPCMPSGRPRTFFNSKDSSMVERSLGEMHSAQHELGSLISDADTWITWPKGVKRFLWKDPPQSHTGDFFSETVREEPALPLKTLHKWCKHEEKPFTTDVESASRVKCIAREDYLAPIWQDFNDMLQDREDAGSRVGAKAQVIAAECKIGRRGCTKNNHNFLFNELVGLVCTKCALVGKEIADIIPEIDPRPSRRSKFRIQTSGDSEDGENGESTSSDLPRETVSKVGETGEAVVRRPKCTLGLIPELAGLLHQHQREGFYFLWKNIGGAGAKGTEPGGCILAHAPGTGKSFLVISFLTSYLQVNPECRTLIIAPKSMLRPWEREFEKWKVDISIFILNTAGKTYQDKENDSLQVKSGTQLPYSKLVHVNRLAMLTKWRGKTSVLITTYSMFSKLIDDPEKKFDREEEVIRQYLLEVPDLLILDEGHFARNQKTKVRKSLMSIKTRLRILLSGTLFQNNFAELFNTLYLVRPGFIGDIPDCDQDADSSPHESAFSSFGEVTAKKRIRRIVCDVRIEGEAKSDMDVESRARRLFEDKFGRPFEIEEAEGSSAVQIGLKRLTKLTKSFVHYHSGRKVLSSLPVMNEFAVVLRPNMKQKRLLREVPCNMTLQAETSVTSICIHPVLYLPATADTVTFPEADPEDGVKTLFVMNLVELCQPRGERVLIFCMQTRPLRLLRHMLAGRFGWLPGKEMVQVDGSMNLDERQDNMDMLNNASNSVKVMLASTKACGEGVSLTGASRLIFLDIEWNPAIYRQAISRAFRIGQKKRVYVYRLIGSQTPEERRYNTAEWKDWVATRIIHATGKHGGKATEFGTPSLCEDRVLQRLINRNKADQWISSVVKQKSGYAARYPGGHDEEEVRESKLH